MWGLLYLAIFALGAAMTYFGVVVHTTSGADDRMIVFPSAIAATCWVFLSATPEVVVGTDSGTLSISLGPERWLFIVLALLTVVWLAGAVIGIFPESTREDADADVELGRQL